MKIKEKLVETKETMKNWCEEHRQGIRDFAWYTCGFVLSGTVMYVCGKRCGIEEGRKLATKDILGDFKPNADNEYILTRVKNETGYLDALMTDEFYNLITSQPSVIKYDDGSWEFENENE